uniref:Uncharacterized protein n=1 Tax=Fagus sylvatica TaxID=28930 RepID=A0A2N9IAA8_FAGSY
MGMDLKNGFDEALRSRPGLANLGVVLGGVVVVAGFWMVEWVTGVEKRRRKEK